MILIFDVDGTQALCITWPWLSVCISGSLSIVPFVVLSPLFMCIKRIL